MGMHVFTYGTLMFDPVWSKVVSGTYEKKEARVFGYKRQKMKGEVYPAMVPGDDTDFVNGIAYPNVNFNDLKRIDEFEGPHFQRALAGCRLPDGSTLIACIYVLDDRFSDRVMDEPWDPARFSESGMDEFLMNYGLEP
ncbi:MAG: gamma-glutamylcyclotransferase [Dehalococcoidia bacterium]|nr:gamma-glutamylcyclotransferase [Dehalococcoidia bacterium]